MAVLGTILKSTTKYASKLNNPKFNKAIELQEKQLKKLLSKAKKTEFGVKYNFAQILKSTQITKSYKENVPFFDYNSMFQKFWHKTLNGVENVSWPGKINNFALTSGTTGAASKRIPVSNQMIQSIKKTSVKQLLTLSKLDLKPDFYEKDFLFLGGSTALTSIDNHFEGDLSGIITGKVPAWMSPFSKPENKIRALKDWGEKIDEIVKNAYKWDIGVVCGVPAWVQIMIERIVDYYGLDDIFQMWPNLKIFVHGGVSFEPYKSKFNEMLQSKVIYLDTYLTSEGFFAYQPIESDSLQLVLNNEVYYEFIPFTKENFDENGELIHYDNAHSLAEVKVGVDYALVVSTCAGTWRYLIGDTIQFKCLDTFKIKITGRTKHFISLCGEHLSVDNMTEALNQVTYKFDFEVREFAVIGEFNPKGEFGHRWFIACDKQIDASLIVDELDKQLCKFNDDYAVERKHALKNIVVHTIPTNYFYEFMKLKDKYGAQHKFPRVMKGQLASDWIDFLSECKDYKIDF